MNKVINPALMPFVTQYNPTCNKGGTQADEACGQTGFAVPTAVPSEEECDARGDDIKTQSREHKFPL